MIRGTLGRFCYAGYHIDNTGKAFDFSGICDPGTAPPQTSTRVCQVPYYSHGGGDQSFYDVSGFCDPSKSAWAPKGSSGIGIGTILLWAGVAIGGYYLWTHRKAIF